MPGQETQNPTPLSPKVFHILMALAAESLNGYQLGLTVEQNSEGAIRLSPGTLYENLHRLAERGTIEELEETEEGAVNGRGQRFYRLTDAGLALLQVEVSRLTRDVRRAESIPAIGT